MLITLRLRDLLGDTHAEQPGYPAWHEFVELQVTAQDSEETGGQPTVGFDITRTRITKGSAAPKVKESYFAISLDEAEHLKGFLDTALSILRRD
jgi:hypothetical protein